MTLQQPGWYTDPLDVGRVRWWDGDRWGDHTHELQPGAHAVATAQRFQPGEPALAPPPSATAAHVRPAAPAPDRTSQDWGDASVPPTSMDESTADDPASPSVVPRLGLALLAVLVVAGSLGAWSWWAERRGDVDAAAGPPTGPEVSQPAADDIPIFIDQPWKRTTPPTAVVSFEFPGSYTTVTGTGPRGLAVTTLVAQSEGTSGDSGNVSCSVFTEESKATVGRLDQEAVAGAALAAAGVSEQIAQFIETAVGPATRFAGNDPQRGTLVRGVVIGNGAASTWCVVTLSGAQDTLADLTLQRIVSTVGPN